jgi:hypothetical protein
MRQDGLLVQNIGEEENFAPKALGKKACEKHEQMDGICICCECLIRETCGVEALLKKAGCRANFVTKCLTKEILEDKNVIEEGQEARRSADIIRRYLISNSFLFEE